MSKVKDVSTEDLLIQNKARVGATIKSLKAEGWDLVDGTKHKTQMEKEGFARINFGSLNERDIVPGRLKTQIKHTLSGQHPQIKEGFAQKQNSSGLQVPTLKN